MEDPRETVKKRWSYEHLKRFMDPWNGFCVNWCGNCGHPMDTIRAGQYVCRLCEAEKVIENLSARLKGWEGHKDADEDDYWA